MKWWQWLLVVSGVGFLVWKLWPQITARLDMGGGDAAGGDDTDSFVTTTSDHHDGVDDEGDHTKAPPGDGKPPPTPPPASTTYPKGDPHDSLPKGAGALYVKTQIAGPGSAPPSGSIYPPPVAVPIGASTAPRFGGTVPGVTARPALTTLLNR